MSKQMKRTVLIIGAGMSGLVAARHLQANGADVTIIDKGRGVGGRMATRRISTDDGREGKADHGAQYLTAHEPYFMRLVEELRRNNILTEWKTTSGIAAATPRYYAPEGMTAVAKYLAQDMKVRLAERVLRLDYGANGWTAHTDKGASISADALIITCPIPQTLRLLDTLESEVLQEMLLEAHRIMLESVEYTSAIVLMGIPEVSPRFLGQPLAPNGGVRIDKEAVWWLADNERKGISPNVPTFTLHATPEFSRRHWDAPEEEIIPKMLGDIADIVGMQRLRAYSLHRWRYSRVVKPFPERYCELQSPHPCLLAGDAFSPSEWLPTRTEDAAVSGKAAAERLWAELK